MWTYVSASWSWAVRLSSAGAAAAREERAMMAVEAVMVLENMLTVWIVDML